MADGGGQESAKSWGVPMTPGGEKPGNGSGSPVESGHQAGSRAAATREGRKPFPAEAAPMPESRQRGTATLNHRHRGICRGCLGASQVQLIDIESPVHLASARGMSIWCWLPQERSQLQGNGRQRLGTTNRVDVLDRFSIKDCSLRALYALRLARMGRRPRRFCRPEIPTKRLTDSA